MYDPEIPVNIWELGLIYDVVVDAAGVAGIRMTLTARQGVPNVVNDVRNSVQDVNAMATQVANLNAQIVSALAAWIPARRASRLAPTIALRAD